MIGKVEAAYFEIVGVNSPHPALNFSMSAALYELVNGYGDHRPYADVFEYEKSAPPNTHVLFVRAPQDQYVAAVQPEAWSVAIFPSSQCTRLSLGMLC